MIQSVLDGSINNESYENFAVFNFQVPAKMEGIDSKILQPKNTWKDAAAYDKALNDLAQLFINNFKQYETGVNENIIKAAPILK
jgi:phosphoenolpyruvate carboxykinase (ATP)